MEQHIHFPTKHEKTLYENQLNSDSIRLLQVLPNEVGEPLQCRLIEVPLATAPGYEAISYVWGDFSITESILCNDVETNITVSLAQALRRLRLSSNDDGIDASGSSVKAYTPPSTDRIRVLWADALCINQQDPIEKGHQVKLMREVYSRAAQVVVWLGDEDPEIVATATLAIKIVHLYATTPTIANLDHLGALMKEQGFEDPWTPLMHHFFASPWFQRIWCVQEAVLAKEITFIIGHDEIEVDALQSFCAWFCEEALRSIWKLKLENASAVVSTNNRLVEVRDNLEYWSKCPFVIFDAFRELAATDPRDKVYGLLGLVGDVSLEVDYTKPVTEVYADTVIHDIKITNGLSCLSYVQHILEYDPGAGYPSWVPRWDDRTINGKFWFYTMPVGSIRGSVATRDPDQQNILQVGGIQFDEVLEGRYMHYSENALMFEETSEEQSFLLRLFRESEKGNPQSRLNSLTLAAALTAGRMSVEYGEDPELVPTDAESDVSKQFLADFLDFLRGFFPDELILPPSVLPDGNAEVYARKVWIYSSYRTLFRTSSGYVGIGPKWMKEGDIVVVLDGSTVPFILRPVSGSSSDFYFLGECYIHDIMFEKGVELLKQEEAKLKTFRLV